MKKKQIILKLIRQAYKKTTRWLITQSYIRKRSIYENDFSFQNEQLVIITVAFNNPSLIENQISLFRLNMIDPYFLVIADNSSDEASSQAIRELCNRNEIKYIRLPVQKKYMNAPSISHGYALNWIFANYIKKRNPDYWGFIDHDVFPVEKSEIIKHITQSPFWGLVHNKCNRWYLWPGFSFFNGKLVNSRHLNFSIASGFEKGFSDYYYLDTGGMNYFKYYKLFKLPEIEQPKYELVQIREGDIHENSFVERIDTFIHTINGSNWYQDDTSKEKDTYIKKMGIY